MAIEDINKPEKLNFNIELATLDDLPSIKELTKKLFDYEIENGFDNNIDSEWSYSKEGEEELQKRINSEESVSLVGKANGKIVGYLIGLILKEETGRVDSKYAELEHMFINQKVRGQGVGEKLVEEFKMWAKKNELKRIKANVSYENQKAIAFYKKIGLIPADVMMSGKIEG